jgi:hypothetical protein
VGDQGAGRFFLQDNVIAIIGLTRAAVLLGDGHAHHAQRPEFFEGLSRHLTGFLPVVVMRADLLLHEFARERTKRLVILGEQVSMHEFPCQEMSSTSVALAVPPPSHMVCNP